MAYASLPVGQAAWLLTRLCEPRHQEDVGKGKR
jgi:hypothetical protein